MQKNAKNRLTAWGENGRERETLGRNGRLCHLLPQLCQQPRTSLRPFLQVDSDTESTGPRRVMVPSKWQIRQIGVDHPAVAHRGAAVFVGAAAGALGGVAGAVK